MPDVEFLSLSNKERFRIRDAYKNKSTTGVNSNKAKLILNKEKLETFLKSEIDKVKPGENVVFDGQRKQYLSKNKLPIFNYNDTKEIFDKFKGRFVFENQKLLEIKKGVYKGDNAAGAGKGVAGQDSGGAAGGATTNLAKKKGVSSNFNNTHRITDSVAMYLPPNVEDTTTATYNDSKTGVAGFLVATGVAAAGKDAAKIAGSIIASTQGILGDMAAKAIGGIAELAGAEGGEQLAKKAFGVADNPYMEVLFDSMGLRTFTYNFNMAPRNAQEADECQRIIQLFRFHMAPELRPGINRYLGLPSQFDIHYMFLSRDGQASENSFYNKISTCVLQDCKINYTPNGVKSFEDGGPTATTMALTFKEIELLTKDKIAEGF